MARQGYDLQLTPTSATGTGWELHAVARDAAGGVGGVEPQQGGGMNDGVFDRKR